MAVAGKEDERMKQFMGILAKLCLNTALQARICMAVCIQQVKLPKDLPVVTLIKESNIQYDAKAKT